MVNFDGLKQYEGYKISISFLTEEEFPQKNTKAGRQLEKTARRQPKEALADHVGKNKIK